MNLKSLVLISSIVLTGCATNTPPTSLDLGLPWPTPMLICEIENVKVTETGEVILSYTDNVNIAICERDMLRYIKDLTNMVCVYQPKDTRCVAKETK